MADGEAADAAAVSREVQRMNNKVYEYESLIYSAGENGGAYIHFPYDIRNGSIVNMGVRNVDGSICYIIGMRKDIRSKTGKQPGDKVSVTVTERE